MRLLLVEDDSNLAQVLIKGLREEGYLVDLAVDGEEALLFAQDIEYEVILLDRKLPRLSGDQVLSELRKKGAAVPILMLTALDSIDDRVKGLTNGADDYVCKPFAFEELLARIQVLRRRKQSSVLAESVQLNGLLLNNLTKEVSFEGAHVELTPLEYRILDTFLRHPGQILSREQLAGQVWENPWEVQDNTIEAHLKNLRKKVEPLFGRRIIQTVRGFGYKLVVPNDKKNAN